jgi:hypothetical protein
MWGVVKVWMSSSEEMGLKLPIWLLWVELVRKKPTYGSSGGEIERDVRYYVMGLN